MKRSYENSVIVGFCPSTTPPPKWSHLFSSMEISFCFQCIIVRAVRSKKYVDCANWDKSMKLGTETHYRLYVKNFKGDTPRKSRDC